MNDANKFETFGEYLLAIKNHSEGKTMDKRLKLRNKDVIPVLTSKELKEIEELADGYAGEAEE